MKYCKNLYDTGENKHSFTTALHAAYINEKYDLAYKIVFDAFYDHDIPVRMHYFWPLLNLSANKSEEGEYPFTMVAEYIF